MSFAALLSSETDQPRTAQPLMPKSTRSSDKDEDPLPLPTDDEVPQATIHMLGQARDALMQLVGALFQAAIEIVDALLRLVQTVAGRDVAEVVDRGVAETLDHVLPDLPTPREDPASVPTSSTPSTDALAAPSLTERSPTVERSMSDPDGLYQAVHEILHTHAQTDEERSAISPALVELVTTGTVFLLSVERRFPGAIDQLQAQDSRAAGVTEPDPVSATGPSQRDGASVSPPQPAAQY